MYKCLYVCIYVCMYVCMYIYEYIDDIRNTWIRVVREVLINQQRKKAWYIPSLLFHFSSYIVILPFFLV